jgi:hypothetical protein
VRASRRCADASDARELAGGQGAAVAQRPQHRNTGAVTEQGCQRSDVRISEWTSVGGMQ